VRVCLSVSSLQHDFVLCSSVSPSSKACLMDYQATWVPAKHAAMSWNPRGEGKPCRLSSFAV
jgi:hypothetical protein